MQEGILTIRIDKDLKKRALEKCKRPDVGLSLATVVKRALLVWIDSYATLPVFSIDDKFMLEKARNEGRVMVKKGKRPTTNTVCRPDMPIKPIGKLRPLSELADNDSMIVEVGRYALEESAFIDEAGNLFNGWDEKDPDNKVGCCVDPVSGAYCKAGKPDWWKEKEL